MNIASEAANRLTPLNLLLTSDVRRRDIEEQSAGELYSWRGPIGLFKFDQERLYIRRTWTAQYYKSDEMPPHTVNAGPIDWPWENIIDVALTYGQFVIRTQGHMMYIIHRPGENITKPAS